jgi:hypothetical protein
MIIIFEIYCTVSKATNLNEADYRPRKRKEGINKNVREMGCRWKCLGSYLKAACEK